MSKPDATPSLTKALGRRAQVNQYLQSISQTLGFTGQPAAQADVYGSNRRLGKDAGRIAERAVNTVELCPKPFGHIKIPPKEIRDDIERLEELEDCAASVESIQQELRDEMNAVRVRLDGYVTQVYTATQGTLNHAFWAAEEQAGLRTAAQPFLGSIEERAGTIRTAMSATRVRNSETATKETEAQAEITSLKLENKFLAGEGLRPSDLRSGAQPLASRGARRPRRTPRR